MKTNLIRMTAALAVMLTLGWSAMFAAASGTSTTQDRPMMKDRSTGHGMMQGGQGMAGHQAMKAEHQQRIAEWQAKETELKAKVAKLDGASQSEKVDLLTDIVKSLVEERSAMMSHMQEMQGRMGMGMGMSGSSGMGSKSDDGSMQDSDAKSSGTPTE